MRDLLRGVCGGGRDGEVGVFVQVPQGMFFVMFMVSGVFGVLADIWCCRAVYAPGGIRRGWVLARCIRVGYKIDIHGNRNGCA